MVNDPMIRLRREARMMECLNPELRPEMIRPRGKCGQATETHQRVEVARASRP
jgi:hypothetical protein